jgi:glycosyltransferase involved in cell wall biosynthesis
MNPGLARNNLCRAVAERKANICNLRLMNLLFLTPYPLHEAPSQRFRFEQYFSLLQLQGHQIRTQSFLSSHTWRLFYSPGHHVKKILALGAGFLRRFRILFSMASYHFVFIHREAAPVGPPVFEWIIAKLLQKKIIYDFDDAIWLTDKTDESPLERFARWRSKVSLICQWSYKVSCGNQYLADYARQFNNRAVIIPTTIDTKAFFNPSPGFTNKSILTIGWTGSHSTLKYLNAIINVIQHLEEKYNHLHFLVIANQNPNLSLPRFSFLPWKKETEAEDLQQIDIGIMPLPDDAWTRGKCGFKALQYMALGIPCVASPVGVNMEIIQHGQNGFLAARDDEWKTYLEMLIENSELRKKIGEAGQRKVEAGYSVSSNTSNFLSLFE